MMTNFTYSVGDLHSYSVDSKLSNVSVVQSSSSTLQAQRHCTVTLSFAINTIGAGLICLFGLVGNFLSISVIGDDPKASAVTVLLLQSLAVADNFFLAAWLIQFSVNDIIDFVNYRSVMWNYLRLYTYPLIFVGQSATIGLTVLVAASRYVAVCRPYHASTYCNLPLTRKAVAVVFTSAVVYNLPRFFEAEMNVIPRNNGSNGMN